MIIETAKEPLMDILRSCEYALQLERESRDYYTENAARLSHASVASVYKGLADEADKHIKFIKGVLKAERSGSLERFPRVAVDAEASLSWRALAETMNDDVVQDLEKDVAILRLGFILQSDLTKYYEATAEKLEGNEKEAFSRLASWSHELTETLHQIYDRVFELYAA